MKIKKVCPKCKSTNIIGIAGKSGQVFARENIANYLQLDAFHAVEKQTYICCDCGYSEEWINDADLEMLKKFQGTNKDILTKDE